MTAGTCLEHPHHEALLQFAQVPRMHIIVGAVSVKWMAERGNEDLEAQRVGADQVSSGFVSLAIKSTAL